MRPLNFRYLIATLACVVCAEFSLAQDVVPPSEKEATPTKAAEDFRAPKLPEEESQPTEDVPERPDGETKLPAGAPKRKATSLVEDEDVERAANEESVPIPEAIRPFLSAAVRITKIDTQTGAADPNPNWQSGMVVDSRGYILTIRTDIKEESHIRVRLADDREFPGEIVALDTKLELMILRINAGRLIPSISITKSRDLKVGEAVLAIPSTMSKGAQAGTIKAVDLDKGSDFPPKLCSTTVKLLPGEGAMLASAAGDPLGIWWGSTDQESFAIPFKVALPFVTRVLVQTTGDAAAERPVGSRPAKKTPEAAVTDTKEPVENVPEEPKPDSVLGVGLAAPLAKSPDISGKWRMGLKGERGDCVIHRLAAETTTFAIFDTVNNRLRKMVQVKWNPDREAFEGVRQEPELKSTAKCDLFFMDGDQKVRVNWSLDGEGEKSYRQRLPNTEEADIEASLNQIWTRLTPPNTQQAAVFKLEFVDANALHDTLQTVFSNTPQPPQLVTDAAEHTLTAIAEPEVLKQVATIVEKIDDAAETRPEVTTIFQLKHVQAEEIKQTIQGLLKDTGVQKFAVDPRTNSLIVVGKPEALTDVKDIIQRLDVAAVGKPDSKGNRFTALAATPASQQLLEQLLAQEASAVAGAERIRELQSSDQSKQAQLKISGYQNQLKHLLGTAFDLKLQLEELQVKELQSRLTQLERQIARRKASRAKIIERRAAELIEGNDLQWNSTRVTTPVPNEVAAGSEVPAPTAPAPKSSTLAGSKGPGPVLTADEQRIWQTIGLHLRRVPEAQVQEANKQFHGGLLVLDVRPNSPADHERILKDDILCGLHLWQTENIPNVLYVLDHPQRPFFGAVRFFVVRKSKTLFGFLRLSDQTEPAKSANATGPGIPAPHALSVDILADSSVPIAKAPRQSSGTGPGVGGSMAELSEAQQFEADLNALPTLEKLQDEYQRVLAATQKARELEAKYLNDKSAAPQLREALKELTQMRMRFGDQYAKIANIAAQVANAYGVKQVRLQTLQKSPQPTNGAEDQVRRDLAALEKVLKNSVVYQVALEAFDPDSMDPSISAEYPAASSAPSSGFHPDVALALLEGSLQAKLELVHFADLNLPFKVALRVREGTGQLSAGDLIVVLNGKMFYSVDQALNALRAGSRNVTATPTYALTGGLTGGRKNVNIKDENVFQPGHSSKAMASFELRVRGEKNETETKYVSGFFVSPDGLVVIPVSSKSIVPEEPILCLNEVTGTARIVASDDEHGLTLLKVESPERKLFSWLKCRTGMPSKGQMLKDWKGNGSVYVIEVNQPYSQPLGKDGFIAATSNSSVHNEPGSPLVAIDEEVQGLVVPWPSPFPDNAAPSNSREIRNLAMPAVHVERLLNTYRKPATPAKASAD